MISQDIVHKNLRLVNISIQKYKHNSFCFQNNVDDIIKISHYLTSQIVTQTNCHNHHRLDFHPQELDRMKYHILQSFDTQFHDSHHMLVHISVHCRGTSNKIPHMDSVMSSDSYSDQRSTTRPVS